VSKGLHSINMSAEHPPKSAKHHPLAVRLECRREYVEGRGSLSEIAARHSIPHQTLRSWCWDGEWTAARNRWKNRQLEEPPSAPVTPAATPVLAANDDGQTHAQASIVRLERQLTALDDQLEMESKPDAWHKLSTARQRLFEQWRVLKGIPLPGSRRPPAKERKRQPIPILIPG